MASRGGFFEILPLRLLCWAGRILYNKGYGRERRHRVKGRPLMDSFYRWNPDSMTRVFALPAQVVDKHIRLAGAKQLKVLAANPGNLSSTPGHHTVEGENQL